jgi:hypothetical protein
MAELSLELLFDQARTEKVVLVPVPVAVVADPVVDAGRPGRKKKGTKVLSVDEKNPYQ